MNGQCGYIKVYIIDILPVRSVVVSQSFRGQSKPSPVLLRTQMKGMCPEQHSPSLILAESLHTPEVGDFALCTRLQRTIGTDQYIYRMCTYIAF